MSVLHAARDFNGVPTELMIQKFEDRVLVIVTQVGKVGSLTEVSIPQSTTLADPYYAEDGSLILEPPPSIELKTLFGSAPTVHASTLYGLYASHIATILWTAAGGDGRRDVIVGLALKGESTRGDSITLTNEERAMFKGVIKLVLDTYA